jgi:hypothetical protein
MHPDYAWSMILVEFLSPEEIGVEPVLVIPGEARVQEGSILEGSACSVRQAVPCQPTPSHPRL